MADMKLTAAQRKRLAREARTLAYEVVEGTAPEFGRGREFNEDGTPHCAIGHAASRADLCWPLAITSPVGVAVYEDWCIAWHANDMEPAGLPWALLSLADALESTP